MSLKKFVDNPDKVGIKRGERAIDQMSTTPQEALTFENDSPASWALWRLSLVLKEIAENLESQGGGKQPPRLIPFKDGDRGCNVNRSLHK